MTMKKHEELREFLAEHDQLLDSHELARIFKFGSARSFRRAAVAGNLPVSVFRLPGRRGWYSRAADVADWLYGATPTRLSESETAAKKKGGA